MRPSRGTAWGLVLTLLTASGCTSGATRTGDPAIDVEIVVSPTPASTTDTRVVVLVRVDGVPAEGAEVTLGAEGADAVLPARSLEAREGGRQASERIVFPAPGDWVLVVGVRLADGRTAGFRWPITVTGPAGQASASMGSVMRARAPGPSSRFSSSSVPPCPSTICRESTSPIPDPPGLVV
jgi:hypothetical protein